MNEKKNTKYERPAWIWRFYRKEAKAKKLKAYISSLKPEESLNLPENLKYLLKAQDKPSQILLAKYLLVFGMDVEQVAVRSGLTINAVRDMEPYYKENLRKTIYINQYKQIALARDMWEMGRCIVDICTKLDLPIYTLLVKLRGMGYSLEILKARLPPDNHPLTIEFYKTIKRKKNKQKNK